jgi:hypothetical protein
MPDFAAENVGYFTAPYEIRSRLGKPVIDLAAKSVQRDPSRRTDAHGGVPGRPGLRHPAGTAKIT